MKGPNGRWSLVLAAAALSVAGIGASGCARHDQPGDSMTSSAAARGDSTGDLSGATRTSDSASGARASEGAAARSMSPAKRTADTSAQHRNDGSMLNPPIHRTDPREPTPEPIRPVGDVTQLSSDLLAQVHALAKVDGCTSSGDCQTLAVGHKACGGPRAYVVYCPKSTDVTLLRARIAELDRADRAAAKGTVSDCMMVTPPRVTVSGGSCRATDDGTRQAP